MQIKAITMTMALAIIALAGLTVVFSDGSDAAMDTEINSTNSHSTMKTDFTSSAQDNITWVPT